MFRPEGEQDVEADREEEDALRALAERQRVEDGEGDGGHDDRGLHALDWRAHHRLTGSITEMRLRSPRSGASRSRSEAPVMPGPGPATRPGAPSAGT